MNDEHTDVSPEGGTLTKAERKRLRKEQKQKEREAEQRKRKMRTFAVYALIALVGVGGVAYVGWRVATAPTIPDDQIVSRDGVHWHATLDIEVNGETVPIPANVGVGAANIGGHPGNMHTHDDDHRIHVEKQGMVRKDDLRLGNFFEEWDSQFTSECIMEHCVDGEHSLRMMVNGEQRTEYDDYLVQDGDRIEIVYE